MKTPARKYTGIFLGLAFGLYVLIGAFNFVVDPFGLFPGPEIEGFNAIKADVDKHVRMVKAYQVRAHPPAGIVVGSSRALLGVPPDDPAWPDDARPVYNLSLYGGYLYEAMRYFQHALALGTVKHALLSLDLWMFDRDWVTRPGFDEARFLVNIDGTPNTPDVLEPLRTLFAWDTLRSSIRTIARQGRDDIMVQHADGSSWWRSDAAWLRTKGSHRQQFGYMEHMFGTEAWQPERERRWNITDPGDPTSPVQMVRQMVRDAYAHGVDLRIVISPSHARIWEVLYAGGMWQTWEDWKRALLQITLEEAEREGKPPYPLWDFSGYNSITTEEIPYDSSPMRWYTDGSHFKPAVGRLMLKRIYAKPSQALPEDFGRLLTPETIAPALAGIRANRTRYAETHPEEVGEAAKWAH
ncbi:hypothetical protein L2D14_07770 [Thalassospiraceae bacterium LMO-JJ14]|nr:hypothetical protein L2D14_07770 [Thalassospiraceae bacterium LMO-JJ14]